MVAFAVGLALLALPKPAPAVADLPNLRIVGIAVLAAGTLIPVVLRIVVHFASGGVLGLRAR